MPQEGILTVQTTNVRFSDYQPNYPASRSFVLLKVADTGVGMDDHTSSQIFEPFFTTKGIGQGNGLGLSVVYGIVKESRGYIWAHSQPGQGTTINICLPACALSREETDQLSARPTPFSETKQTAWSEKPALAASQGANHVQQI